MPRPRLGQATGFVRPRTTHLPTLTALTQKVERLRETARNDLLLRLLPADLAWQNLRVGDVIALYHFFNASQLRRYQDYSFLLVGLEDLMDRISVGWRPFSRLAMEAGQRPYQAPHAALLAIVEGVHDRQIHVLEDAFPLATASAAAAHKTAASVKRLLERPLASALVPNKALGSDPLGGLLSEANTVAAVSGEQILRRLSEVTAQAKEIDCIYGHGSPLQWDAVTSHGALLLQLPPLLRALHKQLLQLEEGLEQQILRTASLLATSSRLLRQDDGTKPFCATLACPVFVNRSYEVDRRSDAERVLAFQAAMVDVTQTLLQQTREHCGIFVGDTVALTGLRRSAGPHLTDRP